MSLLVLKCDLCKLNRASERAAMLILETNGATRSWLPRWNGYYNILIVWNRKLPYLPASP